MNKQQDKARIRQAINNTLHGMKGDPFLAQRVFANAEKGERKVKYAIPKGLVIALIVVLCMGTVAVAAGVYGGAMSWSGEVFSDEAADAIADRNMQEISPEQEQMYVRLNALAALHQQDGERLDITVRENGRITGGISTEIRREAETLEAFLALMAGETHLPLPTNLPEEYAFVRGTIEYTCREGGTWQMVERKSLEDGIILVRYRLDEGDMLARRYSMVFRNPAEDDVWLWIAADLMPSGSSDKQYAGFSESQTPQVVTVPGMEDALAVTAENGYVYLMMRRALQEPVGYVDSHSGVGSFGECVVYADAQGMDVPALISLFAAKK